MNLLNGALTSSFTYKDSSKIAYQTPLYVDNLNAVNSIRIYLRNSITGAQITNGFSPAYSMEFKVTPIMT